MSDFKRARAGRSASGARGKRRKRPVQLALPVPTGWGGARPGAGRKPASGRRNTPHRARPEHQKAHPVLVTLRSAFRPLRSRHVFPTICLAIAEATRREPGRFRVLHFSVHSDHMHLLVEASDEKALSAGIRSVMIRIARSVNVLVSRKGHFWADRWHGRALESPREVRGALVYVFGNFRKHARRAPGRGVDPYSSAVKFDGFRDAPRGREPPLAEGRSHAAMGAEVVVAVPRTWLATTGWRRLGLIGMMESPRGVESAAPHDTSN